VRLRTRPDRQPLLDPAGSVPAQRRDRGRVERQRPAALEGRAQEGE
jgi:hypothetical protein